MRAILSEKNAVIFLFVLVFIIFSFAHEDSKKMEKGYIGVNSYTISKLASAQQQPNSLPKESTIESE
jgi:hypothetical protein